MFVSICACIIPVFVSGMVLHVRLRSSTLLLYVSLSLVLLLCVSRSCGVSVSLSLSSLVPLTLSSPIVSLSMRPCNPCLSSEIMVLSLPPPPPPPPLSFHNCGPQVPLCVLCLSHPPSRIVLLSLCISLRAVRHCGYPNKCLNSWYGCCWWWFPLRVALLHCSGEGVPVHQHYQRAADRLFHHHLRDDTLLSDAQGEIQTVGLALISPLPFFVCFFCGNSSVCAFVSPWQTLFCRRLNLQQHTHIHTHTHTHTHSWHMVGVVLCLLGIVVLVVSDLRSPGNGMMMWNCASPDCVYLYVCASPECLQKYMCVHPLSISFHCSDMIFSPSCTLTHGQSCIHDCAYTLCAATHTCTQETTLFLETCCVFWELCATPSPMSVRRSLSNSTIGWNFLACWACLGPWSTDYNCSCPLSLSVTTCRWWLRQGTTRLPPDVSAAVFVLDLVQGCAGEAGIGHHGLVNQKWWTLDSPCHCLPFIITRFDLT